MMNLLILAQPTNQPAHKPETNSQFWIIVSIE